MNQPSLARQFQGDLEQMIDDYRNAGLTRAETIGMLEIVKLTTVLITPDQDQTAPAVPGKPKESP